MQHRFLVLVGLALALAVSGCDSCGGKTTRAVKSHLKSPDQATAEKIIRQHVESSGAKVGQTVCGIPVKGLSDVKLKIEKSLVPGTFQVDIDAAPVTAPPAVEDAGKADAGGRRKPSTKPDAGSDAGARKPPVRCVAALSILISPVLGADGEISEWRLSSATLFKRKTEGYEYEPPSGGGWD